MEQGYWKARGRVCTGVHRGRVKYADSTKTLGFLTGFLQNISAKTVGRNLYRNKPVEVRRVYF